MHIASIVTEIIATHDWRVYTCASIVVGGTCTLIVLAARILWDATSSLRSALGDRMQPTPDDAIAMLRATADRAPAPDWAQDTSPIRARGGSIASAVDNRRRPQLDATLIGPTIVNGRDWTGRVALVAEALAPPVHAGAGRIDWDEPTESMPTAPTSRVIGLAPPSRPLRAPMLAMVDVPWPIAGPAPVVRHCRVCGCTDDRACDGGCWWVRDPEGGNLCSTCKANLVDPRDELVALPLPAPVVRTVAVAPERPTHTGLLARIREAAFGAVPEGATLTTASPIAEQQEHAHDLTPTGLLTKQPLMDGLPVGPDTEPSYGVLADDVCRALDEPVDVALATFRARMAAITEDFDKTMGGLHCQGYLVDNETTGLFDQADQDELDAMLAGELVA